MSEIQTDRTFGERIVAERERKNWSRAFLAGQSGVTEKTIWRWERGETDPQLDDAVNVATALGVSLDWLAGMSEAVA